MKRIIFDTDPGHDDILAIMTALAHNSELEPLSFVTVAGNQTLDKVTDNILKVEEYLGIDIPVYKGLDKPLVKEPKPQPLAHGESGMDGPILPEPKRKAEELSGIDYYQKVLSSDEKVTIVALAPLTNIGYILKEDPSLARNIEQIVLMGGALNGGNINKYAEFNIWHDPEAAKIVFDSGVKVIMAPLEVCYAGGIMIEETKRFKNGGKTSKLVSDLFEFYCRYAIERNWDKTAVFDLIPVLYLLKPEIFVARHGKVNVILNGEDTQGQTIFNEGEGDHTVLIDTDREECMKVFFNAMDTLDKTFSLK